MKRSTINSKCSYYRLKGEQLHNEVEIAHTGGQCWLLKSL